MSDFADTLMRRLDGKISDDALKIVHIQVNMLITEFNVERKETLPATIFSDVIEAQNYLIARKIEGYSKGTLLQYRRELQRLYNTVQKQTKDITTNDLRLYLYRLGEDNGLSERTQNSIRSYLRAYFNWCVDNNYIEKNPCAQISRIKYEKEEKLPLTNVEMERLRSVCYDIRNYAILETLYSTGCRVKELVNIKLSDIDTESKTITVHGKGKKQRKVYLNARSQIAITNYLNCREYKSEYLFCKKRSPHTKLSERIVEKIIKLLGERAGIANVHPHKIRRTMATDALRHGMKLEEVQIILGHEDISTTLLYAKIDNQDIRRNHEKYVV